MAYASQGQYDRATELLQQFEEDFDREDGAQEVAMRFAKLGLYDRALQFADKAGDYFGPIALVGIATEALKRRDKTKALEVLDTGMRQGEIFSLRWHDVDLENGLLNIQAFHTKTLKERQVAITTRLAIELERLKANALTIGTVWCLVFLTTSNEASPRREVWLA